MAQLTGDELMAIILREHPHTRVLEQSVPALPKPVEPTAPEDQLLR